jgi:hypothetical protein
MSHDLRISELVKTSDALSTFRTTHSAYQMGGFKGLPFFKVRINVTNY